MSGGMKVKTINVDPDGTVLFIHDDDITALMRALGPMTIKRASHVEPTEDGKGWTVDMTLSGGGLYGPFETREFALYFEVEWLKANKGL